MKASYWISWVVLLLLIALVSGRIRLPRSAKLHPESGPGGTRASEFIHYDHSVQAKMDSVVQRLRLALEKAHFESLICFGEPATDDQIRELESQLGYPLPGQLKAFLKIHGNSEWNRTGLVNSGWYFYDVGKVGDMTQESTYWVSAEGGMPRVPEHNGWSPGFVIFMSNDYEFLGVYLEDGQVYELDPESGYSLQAEDLATWFGNISQRLETGQYYQDDRDPTAFSLRSPQSTWLAAPGETKRD